MTFLNTDKTKLSVLVVAFLLLVSAFTFLPAVGAFSPTAVATTDPAPASVTGATVSIDYPILAGYNTSVYRTITVTNPTGNTAITSFTISIPKAAVGSGTPNGTIISGTTGTVTVYGSGPWAIVFSGLSANNNILLPGGAAVTFQIGLYSETTYASTAAVADTYTLSTSVTDITSTSTNLNSITIYESSSTVPAVTGPSGTLTAGTPFTVTVKGEDSGLPLVVSASGLGSDNSHGASATTTLSPTTFTSGSHTSSQSITVNDTTAELLNVTVSGGTKATSSSGGLISGSVNGLNVTAGAVTSLAVEITNTVGATTTSYLPTGANKILNVTSGWGLTPLLGSSGDTNNITVSTADKYGNPVKSTGTTVTLTADTYSGQAAGFNTLDATYAASPYPYTPAHGVNASIQLTIPNGDASVTVPGYYFFGVDYGSQSQIVATSSSGLATGKSVTIVTYTLNPATLTVQAQAPSTTSPKAGTTVTLNATIAGTPQQANVPVNFANYTTDTVGLFSNGKTSINVTTTVTSAGKEVAVATFTPSTVMGAVVTIAAYDNLPGTNAVFTYNSVGTTATLTTQGGTVAKLVVLTAFDSAFASKSSDVTSKGSLYVAIRTADAYGNPSNTAANTQFQLSSTGGLSATILEIASGDSDTVNSSITGFQWSIFTPTSGSSFTITATGTVGGVALTGSTTVTVVSATPLLSVTAPTTWTSGIPSTITGTANASAGILNNQITSIQYSVNGGTAQSVAFTSAANVAFSFSVLLTGASSVNITVKDTAGNSISQTVQIPQVQVNHSFTNSSGIKQVAFTGGPAAVNATFTNNTPGTLTVIVVANVLNSQGAVILESTGTITVAAGASGSAYPVIQGIAHGTYSVQVTVYSLSYVTLSPTTTISVTV